VRRPKKGVGLAVFYKTCLKVSKLVVTSDPISFELLPLRCTCQDCVLTLLLIYRPSSSSVPNFLQELLDLLDEFIVAELLVCCDFYMPGDCSNTIATRLLDVLDGHNITQHVHCSGSDPYWRRCLRSSRHICRSTQCN